MQRISINYDAILERIKEVSTIDTEEVFFVEKQAVSYPGGFDPVRKIPIGSKPQYTYVKKQVTASVDSPTGDSYGFDASGRSLRGVVNLTVHESELNRVGYDPATSDWYKIIDHWIVRGQKFVLYDGSSVIPQTLNGVIYELVFQLKREQAGDNVVQD